MHGDDIVQVEEQPLVAINYGGDANTIAATKGIPKEEAVKIYDNYMKGFPGVKAYQDRQRKYVMQHGFITLNWLTREKAFIYDFDELKKLKENFTQDFWDKYRSIPRNTEGKKVSSDPMEAIMIEDVRKYFKRKSTSEKQAIDYLCQGTGSCMFKTACILLWKYVRDNNLLFKVKFLIPCHDEINIEVPDEMAETMVEVVKDCMLKSAAMFCKKLPIPADAEVGKYWIH